MHPDAQQVLHFWFNEISPKQQFVKDADLDREINQRFNAMHTSATRGECFSWRTAPTGRLAEIILLDQFSRNIYRDSPQAFAWDAMALVLAQEAIASHANKQLTAKQCMFLYMPFMHSESLVIQRLGMPLFESLDLPETLRFAKRHLDIIQRFGRYPHRNALLGRPSTAQERRFLATPGSSF